MTKIILKSDDFFGNSYLPNSRWSNFIKIISDNNVKTSVGVIGKEATNINLEIINELKKLHENNTIRFYNHSFNHLEITSDDNKSREFYLTNINYQKESITKTQEIIYKNFNYKMSVFGAPHNTLDDNALILLNNHPEIKYIYIYPKSYRVIPMIQGLKNKIIILINGYGYLEQGKNKKKIDYDDFIKRFPECEKFDIITYQVHPNILNEEDLKELDKILKFLKSKNCEFIFPEEIK